jgi:DNA-binding transcriptional MerR regulator
MEKLYYSIAEVAEMFEIKQSHLRHMEKEFKQLCPKRNDKGSRFYTPKDLQLVKQILFLVNEQKLTLEGARRKLSQKKDHIAKQQEIVERLKEIKLELLGIMDALPQ